MLKRPAAAHAADDVPGGGYLQREQRRKLKEKKELQQSGVAQYLVLQVLKF